MTTHVHPAPCAPAERTPLLEPGEVAARRRGRPRDDFLTLPNGTGTR